MDDLKRRIAELEKERDYWKQEAEKLQSHPSSEQTTAEKELKEREALYRTQFELGIIGLSVTDMVNSQVTVNEQFGNLLGYSRSEILNVDWMKITHPEDMKAEAPFFDRLLKGEIDSYVFDKRVFHKSSDIIHVHICVSSSRPSDGTGRFIIVALSDITDRVIAEQKLKRSNALLRLVLDTVPLKIYWKDKNCDFLGANRQFLNDYGYSDDREIVGKTDYDFSPPEYAELYRADDQLVMESGTPKLMFEELQIRGDEQIAWLNTYKVPMYGEDGEVYGVLGTSQDITAQKEMEQTSLKRLNQLNSIYETMPLIAWSVDRDGVFTMSEGRALSNIGLKPDEIVGSSAVEIYKDSPDIYEQLKKGLRGESSSGEGNLNGVIFQTFTSPVFNDDGSVSGVNGLFFDVTERRTAQNELISFRNYLSNIIDAMPSVLIAVNEDFRITLWNREAELRLHHPAAEAEDKPINQVIPEGLIDTNQIDLAMKTNTEQYSLGKHRFEGSDQFYENVIIYPIIMNDVSGAVIRIDDVTKETLLQSQLNQGRKLEAIGSLAGGIAHDFNNMLGGIIGAAELILLPSANPKNIERLTNMIIDTSTRAAELTSKLLTFSRQNHKSSTVIDLHSIIGETLALLQNTIDKRISVKRQLNAELGKLVGDPSQLQNAFLNLCINSSQAMPEGGEIMVSTQNVVLDSAYCSSSAFDLVPGNYIEIEISDTGSGIPLDIQDKIYDPFFTTKELGKGTGLGLAAVYGCIQQHKGAIRLYSEVGVGTVFRIYLPLTGQIVSTVPRAPQVLNGSGHILIVDDEELMRFTAKAILEELGYTTVSADNGSEAVDIYGKNDFDAVLLDMVMPKMNGRDCFEKIIGMDPDARVVLSSGFSQEEDVKQMKNKGLMGFIRKPYRSAELSQIMYDILK